MKEIYQKIPAIYGRDSKGNLTREVYSTPYLEDLKECEWTFTEKIDGTNTRICYDGYDIEIKGRKENSQFNKKFEAYLNETYASNKFVSQMEQLFGTNKVILFGEGYGYKIQNGGEKYTDNQEQKFILFDVMVEGKMLNRYNVEDVANRLGLDIVPILFKGTLQQGLDYVAKKPMSAIAKDPEKKMEGVVARFSNNLYDGNGNEIICKIKPEYIWENKEK